jgi:hypothetical protein
VQREYVPQEADFAQRTREAESVQQPECECDDPWHPRREADPAMTQVHDLRGDEDDAQRDRRLQAETARQQAEGRRGQRDAVRDREGCDGLDQLQVAP